MSRSTKANEATHELRVNTIYKLLICAASTTAINQYVKEQQQKYAAEKDRDKKRGLDPWDITERQIARYIAEAKVKIKETLATELEYIKARSLARREFLFESSIKLQDFGKALAIEQDICKLLDLYPKKKIEISNGQIDDSDLEGLTTEEIFSLLEDLKAKKEKLAKSRIQTPTPAGTRATKKSH